MSRLLLVLLALGTLAACGRAGPPRPPGPPDQVIFPRAYPYEPARAVPQAAPAPRR
jgi:predicted small lipoprotein YifL